MEIWFFRSSRFSMCCTNLMAYDLLQLKANLVYCKCKVLAHLWLLSHIKFTTMEAISLLNETCCQYLRGGSPKLVFVCCMKLGGRYIAPYMKDRVCGGTMTIDLIVRRWTDHVVCDGCVICSIKLLERNIRSLTNPKHGKVILSWGEVRESWDGT